MPAIPYILNSFTILFPVFPTTNIQYWVPTTSIFAGSLAMELAVFVITDHKTAEIFKLLN